jgi:hypothetical protein
VNLSPGIEIRTESLVVETQMLGIVDMAIHQVVGHKSYFHGNSYFQNSQNLDPLQIPAKQIQVKIC